MTDTDTLTRDNTDIGTRLSNDDGDHERFAHYFQKKDLDAAFFDGVPIPALCGKKDIPMRDPKRYQVCPTCREIFESIPEGPKDN